MLVVFNVFKLDIRYISMLKCPKLPAGGIAALFTCTKILLNEIALCILPDTRLYEAGYFYAISQRSNLRVNLVQLSEQDNNEDSTASILRAMEEIENLEAEVILLYSRKEIIELMLQKVRGAVLLSSSLIFLSVSLLLCYLTP